MHIGIGVDWREVFQVFRVEFVGHFDEPARTAFKGILFAVDVGDDDGHEEGDGDEQHGAAEEHAWNINRRCVDYRQPIHECNVL